MDRKPNGYWTKERCREEALLYDSRTEYQKESVGSYIKALRHGWLDDMCFHMKTKKIKWTYQKIKEEALKLYPDLLFYEKITSDELTHNMLLNLIKNKPKYLQYIDYNSKNIIKLFEDNMNEYIDNLKNIINFIPLDYFLNQQDLLNTYPKSKQNKVKQWTKKQ